MLLENCTKQDMSESVDCQESISHAGPSCWPRNRLKTATDIASWRLILLERFKIFHFSTISRVSVFLPCYSVTWYKLCSESLDSVLQTFASARLSPTQAHAGFPRAHKIISRMARIVGRGLQWASHIPTLAMVSVRAPGSYAMTRNDNA